jgi:hypothetical protein
MPDSADFFKSLDVRRLSFAGMTIFLYEIATLPPVTRNERKRGQTSFFKKKGDGPSSFLEQ